MNYTKQELSELGISCGDNVRIHKSVLFFGNNVEIGSNVRIDCHCVITSHKKIQIGSHVHIGIGTYLVGGAGITLEDFSGLSARVSLFTTSDDYVGGYLTGPTVPEHFRRVYSGPIVLEKHALVGSGTVILPGVTLGYGCSVGAVSLVLKSVKTGDVMFGSPCKKIGSRNIENLKTKENKFLQQINK